LRCCVGERLQVRSGGQWADFSSRLTDTTTAATDGISRRALTALASFFTHHLSQVKPAAFVKGSAGGDVVLGAVRGQALPAPCGFFLQVCHALFLGFAVAGCGGSAFAGRGVFGTEPAHPSQPLARN
jgi:hypothetical protein